MRRALLCAIAVLAMSAPIQAKVAVLYWPDARVSQSTRAEVELIVKDVAEQYASQSEYTPMGPIDFLHSKQGYRIHVWNQEEDTPIYYWWGDIFCHVSLTLDLPRFRQLLAHEFSHLYDYTMVEKKRKARAKENRILHYRIMRGRVKDPLTKIVGDNTRNEKRAKKREMRYINGPGRLRPKPCTIHGKANECVESLDFDMGKGKTRRNRSVMEIMDAAGAVKLRLY